jgi:methylmalonyl-CoA mutase C-terminal domain/subunit
MRRNRILIGVLGLDQHEVGAIGIARLLRDAGMEVIYTGKFNLPANIVQTSIQEDVDLIGLSCHSWEYLHYIPELMRMLKENHLETPVVIGGSVITRKDEQKVVSQGVAAAFGPNSTDEEIFSRINMIISGDPE